MNIGGSHGGGQNICPFGTREQQQRPDDDEREKRKDE
jgi:hypothetical protein